MQSRNLFRTMKNANLLSNEFNIKLVNEPESVSRVSIMRRKVAKKVIKWSVAECKWPKLINAQMQAIFLKVTYFDDIPYDPEKMSLKADPY